MAWLGLAGDLGNPALGFQSSLRRDSQGLGERQSGAEQCYPNGGQSALGDVLPVSFLSQLDSHALILFCVSAG